jgi:hypothetical protein
MLQARYEDGSPISDDHVTDELLTLLAGGHETTATTLTWTVERLRRHPRLLARLTAEVDDGGSELVQGTIWEVQRTRPVINGTARMTKTRIQLGEWVIPERHAVLASVSLAHASEDSFADAKAFNLDRFVGSPPDNYAWIPYGGGVRRCIGAAFANMEMNVTLRTLLREFEFGSTDAPGERLHSRGVATAPAHGGRAVVYRRMTTSAVTAGQITDHAKPDQFAVHRGAPVTHTELEQSDDRLRRHGIGVGDDFSVANLSRHDDNRCGLLRWPMNSASATPLGRRRRRSSRNRFGSRDQVRSSCHHDTGPVRPRQVTSRTQDRI